MPKSLIERRIPVKALLFLFVASLVLSASSTVSADEKADTKTLILGTWVVSKQVDDEPPIGTTFQFSKDGKLKMSGKYEGKEFTLELSYTIEGDKVTFIGKDRDEEKKDTYRINKLTEEALVLLPERKLSKVIECKRPK
jgi:uncharacterized protein (TIGR03066 family)